MKLDIITPDKKVFSGEIRLIRVPGRNGSFEVLQNHAPIVSTLEKGIIKIIETNNQETILNIDSGVIEVLDNTIIVLVEQITA